MRTVDSSAWHYVRSMLLCLLAACFAPGCPLADRSTAPATETVLKIRLTDPSPQLASLISIVTLSVCEGFDTTCTASVDTSALEGGEVEFRLDPENLGLSTFVLRAFTSGDILLFRGWDTLRIAESFRDTLNIRLWPTVLMLRPSPLFQRVSLLGGSLVDVSVDVHNVDTLFGASFRLFYDTALLSFVGDEEGDFLKGGDPSAELISLSLDEGEGYIAHAISRTRQTGGDLSGVSGSGRLVTFTFEKKKAGTADITLGGAIRLERPDGALVTGFDALILETGQVEITTQLLAADMLLPLNDGNRWTYARFKREPSGMRQTGDVTMSVAGSAVVDGGAYRRLRQSDGSESLAQATDSGTVIGFYGDGAWRDDVCFRYPVDIDDGYQYVSLATGEVSSVNVSAESISVPAGTFDCLVYVRSDETYGTREWHFAPGVGLVHTSQGKPDEAVAGQTSWGLVSYSIVN